VSREYAKASPLMTHKEYVSLGGEAQINGVILAIMLCALTSRTAGSLSAIAREWRLGCPGHSVLRVEAICFSIR
jgi:hypothetical protein